MPFKIQRNATCMAVIAAFLAITGRADAFQLAFSCIAPDNQEHCATGEAQLEVEVADTGGGEVAFILTNNGSADSAIARVYVDDKRHTLAGPPEIHQDAPSVIFVAGANPKNLPNASAKPTAFKARPDLSVLSTSPRQMMGVNPGEQVGLVYRLSPGRSFRDVIADLTIGNLRIGLHVVGFPHHGSESFVSRDPRIETSSR